MGAFDLQVFNKQVYLAMTEVVDQQINLFNDATAGAITLVQKSDNLGDFTMEASFQAIKNLVRRRNVYGTGTLTPARLKQLKDVAVKVAAGTQPVEFEPGQYEWILKNPELFAVILGEQLAPARVQDMLNAGLNAAVAAISGNTAMVKAITTAPKHVDLAKTAGKFGDRQGALAAWILHSATMTNIWVDGLTNGERLFTYGTINIVADSFGRRFVMTDSPALGDGTDFNTLGLVPQGVVIEQNNDFNAVMVDKVGEENIKRTYQAEWSYNVGIQGYAWDEAAGGKSPNDTAIGTSTNWKKIASSDKDTAGVLLTSK